MISLISELFEELLYLLLVISLFIFNNFQIFNEI